MTDWIAAAAALVFALVSGFFALLSRHYKDLATEAAQQARTIRDDVLRQEE
jgi:hypothetical protein